MSHFKERKEKFCLNCNNRVHGRFCHVCGQENIEPKETVWHLVTHFFSDITHFDGKFFSTIKWLLLRPGFLSKEYMIGRRIAYVNPIRMYIFTSAIFFLVFFTFFQQHDTLHVKDVKVDGKTLPEIQRMDSASFSIFTRSLNIQDSVGDIPMTRERFDQYRDSALKIKVFTIPGINYRSKAQYDSLLASGVKKHNWLQRQFVYKVISIRDKYDHDAGKLGIALKNSMFHSLPQMLFISLPFLALLLKLLYIRRKQFYYVNHAVFSLHLYIFVFISLFIFFSLTKLNEVLNWSAITFFTVIGYLSLFFYQYKAMRNFYGQRRAKTILKFLLLNFLFFFILMILFVVFIFFSLLNI